MLVLGNGADPGGAIHWLARISHLDLWQRTGDIPMSKFAIGDLVEIVPSRPSQAGYSWCGRRVTVVAVGVDAFSFMDGGYPGVRTVPRPYDSALWREENLRKINPPDWEAPRVTDRELVE
jgi:hypothetical protein